MFVGHEGVGFFFSSSWLRAVLMGETLLEGLVVLGDCGKECHSTLGPGRSEWQNVTKWSWMV